LDLSVIVALANERFEPDPVARANIDLRLKCAAELHVANGKPQTLLELHARLAALVHAGIKEHCRSDCGVHPSIAETSPPAGSGFNIYSS